ncbi:ADP-ribosylglycohydrolase family protein [Yinghuangia sp. YIM S09857]|uniref:ADP-ribosylglycohydrolase family protein n=1 Tax=Yinghuangia sp. YIM S09857 TaxID=3436929 RepID=UPI003F538D90
MFVAIDHVQLAIPVGGEDLVRAFYAGPLGMTEVPKPDALAVRGGCWFAAGPVQLHLGVEADFRPARKAHPALVADDIDALAERLAAAGAPVRWSNEIPGVRRFHTEDPVGNRIEVLASPADRAERPCAAAKSGRVPRRNRSPTRPGGREDARMERIRNAARSLRGLALGDAFGQRWFFRKGEALVDQLAARRTPDESPWHWTDDTAMALSVVRILHLHGHIDQDALADHFAATYTADPNRGYGGSMHGVLRAIHDGGDWREITAAQFEGQGSWGNGSAMRVAPLGAWYALDDLDLVVEQAALSAEATHAHPEATAGAVAVAVAAALMTAGRDRMAPDPDVFLGQVADHTPHSEVRGALRTAASFPPATTWLHAAEVLGTGKRMSCPDTVPFALWTAARHPDDLVEALWTTAFGLGDVDTTCAITAGVVSARTDLDRVPQSWLTAAELLPAWAESGSTTH